MRYAFHTMIQEPPNIDLFDPYCEPRMLNRQHTRDRLIKLHDDINEAIAP